MGDISKRDACPLKPLTSVRQDRHQQRIGYGDVRKGRLRLIPVTVLDAITLLSGRLKLVEVRLRAPYLQQAVRTNVVPFKQASAPKRQVGRQILATAVANARRSSVYPAQMGRLGSPAFCTPAAFYIFDVAAFLAASAYVDTVYRRRLV